MSDPAGPIVTNDVLQLRHDCGALKGVADILNRLHEAQQTCFRPIWVGENRRTSHQHIGSRLHHKRGRLEVDAAINLQLTMRIALLQ